MRSWFVTEDAPELREASQDDATSFEVVRLSDHNTQIEILKADYRARLEDVADMDFRLKEAWGTIASLKRELADTQSGCCDCSMFKSAQRDLEAYKASERRAHERTDIVESELTTMKAESKVREAMISNYGRMQLALAESNRIIELLESQRDDAITREWMEHEYEDARLTYNAEIEELGQKDGTK